MKIQVQGRWIDLLDLKPSDLRIGMIAQSLARTVRFRGLLSCWTSVAEHCVIVSHLVPENEALGALLHDAAETFLGDIPTPIKQDPTFSGVRALEKAIMSIVEEKWSVDTDTVAIQKADRMACYAEAAAYLEGAEEWVPAVYFSRVPEVRPQVPAPFGWGIRTAEARFLERYQELVS